MELRVEAMTMTMTMMMIMVLMIAQQLLCGDDEVELMLHGCDDHDHDDAAA